MVIIKTLEEIEKMRRGGRILAQIINTLIREIKPGIKTGYLNQLAEQLILQSGGRPSFKGHQDKKQEKPFPTSLCTSINNELVHAPALPSRLLKEGDIIGLDLGIWYQDLCTDMAVTVGVGRIKPPAQQLIKVTKRALNKAITVVKTGNQISDISRTVQKWVEKYGFSVIRDLVGHGVGKAVHEDPKIPNFIVSRPPPHHPLIPSSKRRGNGSIIPSSGSIIPSSGSIIPSSKRRGASEHPLLKEEGKWVNHPLFKEEGREQHHPLIPSSKRRGKNSNPLLPEEGCSLIHPLLPEEGREQHHPLIPSSKRRGKNSNPLLSEEGCSLIHPLLPEEGCRGGEGGESDLLSHQSIVLKEGMVLAIEPMVSLGKPQVKTLKDGWTVVMADGSLACHFEHTVAVTKRGGEVLTIEP